MQIKGRVTLNFHGRAWLVSALLLGGRLLVAGTPAPAPLPGTLDESTFNEMRYAMRRGVDYLLSQQRRNGTWAGGHPGVTAVCTIALLRSPQRDTPPVRNAVAKALPQIREFAEKAPNSKRHDSSHIYSICVSLIALQVIGAPKDQPTMLKLRAWLRQFLIQSMGSGQLRYPGGQIMPDISNLHWAMEALKLTDALGPAAQVKKIWPRAERFITRCQVQNYSPDANGGFTYSPNTPKNRKPLIWGSLTYAGIRSLLFAGVKPTDRRIKQALAWTRRHNTVKENPGLFAGGYFYYLYLFSSAHLLLEQGSVPELEPNWRLAIATRLLSIQKSKGQWANTSRLWLEGYPSLCTAYALLNLELISAPEL